VAVVALLVAVASFGYSYLNRPQTASVAGQDRVFVVTVAEESFNQSLTGIPNYSFVPSNIVVNQGDTVTIHFYDTDVNKHTFTIAAPYDISIDLSGGENQNVTFVAKYSGIFTYYCIYHLPTMVGQLTVLSD